MRWRRISTASESKREESLKTRAVAVYADADANFALPSKNAIKESKLQVAPEHRQDETILTMFGALELNLEGLYHVPSGDDTCSRFQRRISAYNQD